MKAISLIKSSLVLLFVSFLFVATSFGQPSSDIEQASASGWRYSTSLVLGGIGYGRCFNPPGENCGPLIDNYVGEFYGAQDGATPPLSGLDNCGRRHDYCSEVVRTLYREGEITSWLQQSFFNWCDEWVVQCIGAFSYTPGWIKPVLRRIFAGRAGQDDGDVEPNPLVLRLFNSMFAVYLQRAQSNDSEVRIVSAPPIPRRTNYNNTLLAFPGSIEGRRKILCDNGTPLREAYYGWEVNGEERWFGLWTRKNYQAYAFQHSLAISMASYLVHEYAYTLAKQESDPKKLGFPDYQPSRNHAILVSGTDLSPTANWVTYFQKKPGLFQPWEDINPDVYYLKSEIRQVIVSEDLKKLHSSWDFPYQDFCKLKEDKTSPVITHKRHRYFEVSDPHSGLNTITLDGTCPLVTRVPGIPIGKIGKRSAKFSKETKRVTFELDRSKPCWYSILAVDWSNNSGFLDPIVTKLRIRREHSLLRHLTKKGLETVPRTRDT